MNKVTIPTRFNLTSAATKLQVIKLLEYMRSQSTDKAYNDYCEYCLDVVKQSIEFHYYEVIEFIGIEEETVPAATSAEVTFLMSMFDHISKSLAGLSYEDASNIEKEYYVYFCGFDASNKNHLAYYIFLVRNNKYRVPIFSEALPITLDHYREMLKRYERYKRDTDLSKEMLMEICIRREQQIKFML